ncbi:TPA: exonuclease [Photobacterium damselae]
MKKKRLLLLDGDIFAFQAASSSEHTVDWTDELWTLHAEPNAALAKAINNIEEITEQLEADAVICCFTDKVNWRYEAMETYKSNRKTVRKPMVLQFVKDGLAERYETFIRPTLEADDLMGILATWNKFRPDYEKIIVSADKDMQTIPCNLFNPQKDKEVRVITQEQADFFWHCQALAGDVTDGYSGCTGVGMETAKELLSSEMKWEQYEHTFKSGARKGLTELRWQKVPAANWWETVTSCYAKAGLDVSIALENARVSRICRHGDYDMKNKKVVLWTYS